MPLWKMDVNQSHFLKEKATSFYMKSWKRLLYTMQCKKKTYFRLHTPTLNKWLLLFSAIPISIPTARKTFALICILQLHTHIYSFTSHPHSLIQKANLTSSPIMDMILSFSLVNLRPHGIKVSENQCKNNRYFRR